MLDGRHSLRKELLRITVSTEALALAVRPRLDTLNRTVLLDVVERVLDEFSAADLHVRLDRLEIDLGTIDAGDLERLMPIRLEQQLRHQLATVLGRGSSSVTIRSTTDARLDAIDHFIARGTLPHWVAPDGPDGFDADALIGQAVDTAPAALAALVRRRSIQSGTIRRLVYLLRDATLGRLLHALAPDQAALILLYMAEIRDYHAIVPLIPASSLRVARLLWEVALAYTARDPGTQFNRRSLVEQLLRGLATAERLRYEDVLGVFDMGVETVGDRQPIATTLLALVDELIEEERAVNPWFAALTDARRHMVGASTATGPRAQADDPPRTIMDGRYAAFDALRYVLRFGVMPWTARLGGTRLTLPDLLAQLPTLTRSMLTALSAEVMPSERVAVWEHLLRFADDVAVSTLTRSLASAPADGEARVHGPSRRGVPLGTGPDGARAALAQELSRLVESRSSVDDSGATSRDERAAAAWPSALVRLFESPASLVEPRWDATLVLSVLTERALGPGPALGTSEHAAASSRSNPFAPASPPGQLWPATRADLPSSAELLTRLVERAPDDLRAWIDDMREQHADLEPLLEPALKAPDLLVRTLLSPEIGMTIAVLMAALGDLPTSERPASLDRMHGDLLRLALAVPPGETGAAFLQRALHGLFGTRPIDTLASRIPAAVQGLSDRGTISQTLGLALLEGLARADVTTSSTPETARGSAASEQTSQPLDRTALVVEWLGTSRDAPPGDAPRLSRDTIRLLLRRAVQQAPHRIQAALRDGVVDVRIRRRWVASLGETELAQAVALLAPGDYRPILESAERLFSSLGHESPFRGSPAAERTAFWLFVLEFLAATPPSQRTIARLTQEFLRQIGRPLEPRVSSPEPPSPPDDSAVERVRLRAWREARRAGDAALVSALGEASNRAPSQPAAPARVRPAAPTPSDARRTTASQRMAFSMDGDDDEAGTGEPIYVANAGLVLAAPFLPRLFQTLDMLDAGAASPRIRDTDISRAVRLLQWIVDGRVDTPEPLLPLNKLLCGLRPATPVESMLDLGEADLEMGATLLRSLIANWPIIRNTSIAGLQETFLQRDGRLERASNGWRLTVARRTVDVLLDQLPWSLTTVVHSLMPEPIFVKW